MDKGMKIRELTDKNIMKVNIMLSKAALTFLMLCPVVLLINAAGITSYDMKFLIKVCIGIIVLSVLPFIMCPKIYDEKTCRYLVLGCIEVVGYALYPRTHDKHSLSEKRDIL